MNGKELVTDFLVQKQNQVLDYLTLQNELLKYNYVQHNLGKCRLYRIDSLERYFRWVIEEKLLSAFELEAVEVSGKYKTWLIQSIYPLFRS